MIPTDEPDLLRDICNDERGINLETLHQVILLAVEIAREGREGRKIGTMIIPELRLLRRRGLLLKGPYSTRRDEQMTVASKKE
jgi:hypothetical protein